MENWPSPEHKAAICIYTPNVVVLVFVQIGDKSDRRHLIPIIRDIILP